MGSRRLAFVSSAEEAASAGVPAVVIPDAAGKLPAEYASDFWCYAMFRAISESMGKPVPVGTMGLCIRSGHPWLRHFTREAWTVPAWYSILRTAHCESISCPDPVVQMIDNTERCQRLGILWQQNGLPHLTARRQG